MRAVKYGALAFGVLFILTAGGIVTVDLAHHSSWATTAANLQATWDQDVKDGVPPASLTKVRQELAANQPTASAWSPTWLTFDSSNLVNHLNSETASAWESAMTANRQQAQGAIDDWSTFAQQQNSWITPAAQTSTGDWPKQLKTATTPAALAKLSAQWQAFLTDQRKAVLTAQKAKLESEVASIGGTQTLIATAIKLSRSAAAANLDDNGTGQLAAQLQDQLNNNGDATQTATQLVTAVGKLQATLNLNNQVASSIRPIMLSIIQIQAEGTSNSASLASQYQAANSAFSAARNSDQLNAVNQLVTSLKAAISAELTANQCGHSVGSGKVITVSLALQEMLFYQDGCVVQATPVSTGRPQLRTPPGNFSIFYKKSPFTFVSDWPPSSPFYYPPSPVSWVMEFAQGGYFIHDAPWEPANAFGPGSENSNVSASHGCIHVPTHVMSWAYSWASTGTSVVIS